MVREAGHDQTGKAGHATLRLAQGAHRGKN
jgi:hypothetical protein